VIYKKSLLVGSFLSVVSVINLPFLYFIFDNVYVISCPESKENI
jgi:TPP-dependent pyruvate/acetoin dehydrogenase alpha subunit